MKKFTRVRLWRKIACLTVAAAFCTLSAGCGAEKEPLPESSMGALSSSEEEGTQPAVLPSIEDITLSGRDAWGEVEVFRINGAPHYPMPDAPVDENGNLLIYKEFRQEDRIIVYLYNLFTKEVKQLHEDAIIMQSAPRPRYSYAGGDGTYWVYCKQSMDRAFEYYIYNIKTGEQTKLDLKDRMNGEGLYSSGYEVSVFDGSMYFAMNDRKGLKSEDGLITDPGISIYNTNRQAIPPAASWRETGGD